MQLVNFLWIGLLTVPQAFALDECAGKDFGYKLADPVEPNAYYLCLGILGEIRNNCPEGFHFNEDGQICEKDSSSSGAKNEININQNIAVDRPVIFNFFGKLWDSFSIPSFIWPIIRPKPPISTTPDPNLISTDSENEISSSSSSSETSSSTEAISESTDDSSSTSEVTESTESSTESSSSSSEDSSSTSEVTESTESSTESSSSSSEDSSSTSEATESTESSTESSSSSSEDSSSTSEVTESTESSTESSSSSSEDSSSTSEATESTESSTESSSSSSEDSSSTSEVTESTESSTESSSSSSEDSSSTSEETESTESSTESSSSSSEDSSSTSEVTESTESSTESSSSSSEDSSSTSEATESTESSTESSSSSSEDSSSTSEVTESTESSTESSSSSSEDSSSTSEATESTESSTESSSSSSEDSSSTSEVTESTESSTESSSSSSEDSSSTSEATESTESSTESSSSSSEGSSLTSEESESTESSTESSSSSSEDSSSASQVTESIESSTTTSSAIQEANDYCDVSPNGAFFRDPKSCNRYYVCANNQAISRMCPHDLHFDIDRKVCNFPHLVDCTESMAEQFSTDSVLVSFSDDGISSTDSETLFTASEVIELLDDSLVGRNSSNSTSNPNNFSGNKPITENDQIPHKKQYTDSNMNASQYCSIFPNGAYIRDSNSCNKYYMCANGQAIFRVCPKNLYFDMKQKVCNFAHLVDCSKNLEQSLSTMDNEKSSADLKPSGNKSNKINSKQPALQFEAFAEPLNGDSNKPSVKEPISEAVQMPVMLHSSDSREYCSIVPNGTFFRDPQSCNKYYVCANGQAISRECPKTLYFDIKKKVCNFAHLVDCTENLVQSFSTFSLLDDQNTSADVNPPKTSGDKYKKVDNKQLILQLGSLAEIDSSSSSEKKPNSTIHAPKQQDSLDSFTMASEYCRTAANGAFFRDRESCNKYYMCANGQAISRVCPKNLYFDMQKKVCNFAQLVDCSENMEQILEIPLSNANSSIGKKRSFNSTDLLKLPTSTNKSEEAFSKNATKTVYTKNLEQSLEIPSVVTANRSISEGPSPNSNSSIKQNTENSKKLDLNSTDLLKLPTSANKSEKDISKNATKTVSTKNVGKSLDRVLKSPTEVTANQSISESQLSSSNSSTKQNTEISKKLALNSTDLLKLLTSANKSENDISKNATKTVSGKNLDKSLEIPSVATSNGSISEGPLSNSNSSTKKNTEINKKLALNSTDLLKFPTSANKSEKDISRNATKTVSTKNVDQSLESPTANRSISESQLSSSNSSTKQNTEISKKLALNSTDILKLPTSANKSEKVIAKNTTKTVSTKNLEQSLDRVLESPTEVTANQSVSEGPSSSSNSSIKTNSENSKKLALNSTDILKVQTFNNKSEEDISKNATKTVSTKNLEQSLEIPSVVTSNGSISESPLSNSNSSSKQNTEINKKLALNSTDLLKLPTSANKSEKDISKNATKTVSTKNVDQSLESPTANRSISESPLTSSNSSIKQNTENSKKLVLNSTDLIKLLTSTNKSEEDISKNATKTVSTKNVDQSLESPTANRSISESPPSSSNSSTKQSSVKSKSPVSNSTNLLNQLSAPHKSDKNNTKIDTIKNSLKSGNPKGERNNSIALTNGKESLNCSGLPNGAFLRDPQSCGKFYVCSDGYAVPQSCPGALYFDIVKKVCNFPSLVNCQINNNGTYVATNATSYKQMNGVKEVNSKFIPDCSTVALGEYLRDPNSCNKFYVCVDGQAIQRHCPKGLYIDTNRKLCNFPMFVECPHDERFIKATSPVATEVTLPDCSGKTEGFYIRDSKMCNKYYVCHKGAPVVHFCKPGLWFDLKRKVCDQQRLVECKI